MKLLKNTKVLLVIILCFICLNSSLFAQDIFLKVKKGTVTHNSKTLLVSNPAFQMKASDKITVNNGSVLSGRMGESFFQVPSGKTYSFEEVKKLAKGSISKSSIASELFTNSMQITKNNYGSSTRSGENDPDFYSPSDAPDILTVLDDKLRLEIGNNKTKLLSNIRLINTDNAEVTYDEKPNNLSVELTNLPEGNYKWTYQIEFDRDDTKFKNSFENSFIIPSAKNKTVLLKDYNNYKNQLMENKKKKLISDDFYQILLEEYKAEKKIYTKL
jgi:hypothetical protein